jgi:hypothetical protein
VTSTLAAIAARLRKVADALDATDVDVPVSAYLAITPVFTLDESKSVARVDTVAELLGLTAAPTKAEHGSTSWYHQARDDHDGVDLRVYTHIKAPAQRCACGAVCTHTDQDGAR